MATSERAPENQDILNGVVAVADGDDAIVRRRRHSRMDDVVPPAPALGCAALRGMGPGD